MTGDDRLTEALERLQPPPEPPGFFEELRERARLPEGGRSWRRLGLATSGRELVDGLSARLMRAS